MDKILLAEKAQAPTLAANDARQPLAAVPHDDDAAFALHAAITELLTPVPEIDQGGSSCSRLAFHAVGLLNDADKSDDAQWVNSIFDVEAMLRGALGCGDGISSQHTLLTAALQKVWTLLAILEGGGGKRPPEAGHPQEMAEPEFAQIPIDRVNIAGDACCLIEPLGSTVVELLENYIQSDAPSPSRLNVAKDIVKRMSRLSMVALSAIDDDVETIESLSARLEGSAA